MVTGWVQFGWVQFGLPRDCISVRIRGDYFERHVMKFQHLFIAVVAAAFLTGCQLPMNTRESGAAYKLIARADIEPARVHIFEDCILHGFNRNLGVGFPDRTRTNQQKFDSYSRIDSINGSVLILASVDIFKSGVVELHEAVRVMGSSDREMAVFGACLEKVSP